MWSRRSGVRVPSVTLLSTSFEEIDRRATAMGEIVLRRRLEPSLHVDVYEVKLGDEFLMSSLFTASEIALANLSLAEVPDTQLDVIVGGLGLGYTARAVLADARVRSLHVVDAWARSSSGTRPSCSRSPPS